MAYVNLQVKDWVKINIIMKFNLNVRWVDGPVNPSYHQMQE